jgi:hypothetical protein
LMFLLPAYANSGAVEKTHKVRAVARVAGEGVGDSIRIDVTGNGGQE